jgi:hypothetical protein
MEPGGPNVLVNPDRVPIDVPSGNPHAALSEIERRQKVAASDRNTVIREVAASAEFTPVMAAIRDQYMQRFSGFAIINCSNEAFVNRCMVPNVRILQLFMAASPSVADMAKAKAEADARVLQLVADPRIIALPIVIPLNIKVQIPYSEASATAPKHVQDKIARNSQRHEVFRAFRNAEFVEHVGGAAGQTELSSYHRWKMYCNTKRTMTLASFDAEAVPLNGDEMTAADALRLCAAEGRRVYDTIIASKMKKVEEVKEEAAASALPDIGGIETVPAVKTSTPRTVAIDNVFLDRTRAPPPIVASNPAKWQVVQDQTEVYPADQQTRVRFVPVAFFDDLDLPEDSPEFPRAAGMEPIFFVFGCAFAEEEDAKAAIKEYILPWCTGADVKLVSMYEWLYPTEVDPDSLKEEHRTGNEMMTEELGLVMNSRANQMKMVQQAQQLAGAGGHGQAIPTIYANARNAPLPDVDEVLTAPALLISSIEQGRGPEPSVSAPALPEL